MPSQRAAVAPVTVTVENIGGIDESTVELAPGVSVLTGRNATNRTSFLRAIMAALGSDDVALKGDAETGRVELQFDGETATRTLTRQNGATNFGGDPYLEDSELADRFAFLLESNVARRAVERGDNLYDVIMDPVDTDQIDAEIDQLETEREELDVELEELETLGEQLPALEEERSRLEAELESKRAELGDRRAELDAREAEAADVADIEDRFDQLRDTRTQLDEVRRDIDDERRIVEALHEDRADMENDLGGLAVADDDEIADVEAELSRHRDAIQQVESTLGDLQSAIQFNESLLEGESVALVESVREGRDAASDGSVTDRLLGEDEELVCWTCGSQVERPAIEQTIDLLRELHAEQRTRRNNLRERVDELEADRKHLERVKEERSRLRRQLDDIEVELEERTGRIDALESEADALEAAVEEFEAAIDDLETDGDDHLELHRDVNRLELEVDQLEANLEDRTAEIDSIENRLDDRDVLRDQRAAIDDEIEALRSRIERLEADAVEQFNGRMDSLLDRLEFDNLERIWIERVEREVTARRGATTETDFELHVIRATESGSVYEDAIEHLSESERDVVGVVFALSGYLVHEVYEQVPFMLLDSLEALDSGRIATLIEYVAEYATNLVVALLPEDAEAVDDGYQRVTEI